MKTKQTLKDLQLDALKKSVPKVAHLSDELQSDIVEFGEDRFDDGYAEGKEDAENDETLGISRAYELFEEIENWDQFVELRKELLNRSLSGL